MIKAKDLMIGDYINSSFGIAQVISIDKVGVTLINKDNGEFDIDFLDNDAWLHAGNMARNSTCCKTSEKI